MAKAKRKSKDALNDKPVMTATNGHDKHFLRDYKGFTIHDSDKDDQDDFMNDTDRKITVTKDGALQYKITYDPTDHTNLNRAIEAAKEFIDHPEGIATVVHADPFAENTADTVDPGAVVKYQKDDIEIMAVELRNGMFLNLEYFRCHDDNQVRNPRKEQLNWPVHSDLLKAFDAFIPHLLFITEIIDDKKIKSLDDFEHPLLSHFAVTAVALNKDMDGVSVTGHRKLRNKRVFAMNPPSFKWYGSGKDEYKFGDDADMCWKSLDFEVREYLNGRKRGKRNDPELAPPVGKAEDAPFVESSL